MRARLESRLVGNQIISRIYLIDKAREASSK